ncbi:MAG: spermidine synthase [Bacteroidia bacterium]
MTKKNKQNNIKTQVNNLGFLFWVKWVCSFVWPMRIVSSENEAEYIELVLYQGKRLLNSRNANYSNGNLQLAFKRLFEEVDLSLKNRDNALVMGFGLGGVSRLLNTSNSSIKQVGVEHNGTILHWYKTFEKAIPNVDLVQIDASVFIDSNESTYQMIVVDLYTDLNVPTKFQSKEFLQKLSDHLTEDGVLIFNKVVITDQQKTEANQLMIDLSTLFKSVFTNEQLGMNRFLIASNQT